MELPVIDIGPGQFSDEQNERDEGGQKQQEEEHILREIRAACETTGPGFFYLKMTAEEEMLADEALKMSRKFFKLPMSTKRRLDNDKDTFYKVDGIAVPGSGPGYRAPNLDPNFLKDARETYQVGRDDIPETHGKTPFPPEEDLPHFKDVCTRYMTALMKKSEKLRRAIAVSIGKPQDYFEKYFERGTFLLGMNRYWRRRSNPETGEYGIAPHEDDGVFTLLHTDGQPGLEIAPDWKGDGRMRSHSMHDLELRWEPISHKKGYVRPSPHLSCVDSRSISPHVFSAHFSFKTTEF